MLYLKAHKEFRADFTTGDIKTGTARFGTFPQHAGRVEIDLKDFQDFNKICRLLDAAYAQGVADSKDLMRKRFNNLFE